MTNISRNLDSGLWVVIPAYNEATVLTGVLESALQRSPNVVLVDDGSSDNTNATARAFPVHYVRHRVNLGQGAALQTGISYALARGADVIVTLDADGQMDPDDIPALTQALHDRSCDVALGTRFGSADVSSIPLLRKILLKLAVAFTRMATGLTLSDTHNGFRAFKRAAAEKLNIRQNGMAHASEVLQQISTNKFSYAEVPVHIRYTPYSLQKGQSSLNAFNILWELFFR